MSFICEIEVAIKHFSKAYNITLSDADLLAIIEENKARTRINLCLDTYLIVCEFIHPVEIFRLTTCCKEFMEFYPEIWFGIQKRHFPKSLLKSREHKTIRSQFALAHWYDTQQKFSKHDLNNLQNIHEDETFMSQRITDLKTSNKSAIKTHLAEISSYKKSIKSTYDELKYHTKKNIEIFQYYTKNNGLEKFMCLRDEPNMKFYGLNPLDDDDVNLWESTGINWVTGKYNTSSLYEEYMDEFLEDPNYLDYCYYRDDMDENEIDINIIKRAVAMHYEDDGRFNYELDFNMYRIRILPSWLESARIFVLI
jgi:hypothetical protein